MPARPRPATTTMSAASARTATTATITVTTIATAMITVMTTIMIIITATVTIITTTSPNDASMSTLFDRYLMVDWSGASTPTRGADSIWSCLLEPRRKPRLENHPTRHDATETIRTLLRDSVAAGKRVLAGFDFSFAYPAGFAKRLGLTGAPWRAVWELLAREIADGPDNRNNRFAVAASLNRRLGGEAFPFWGCPERHVCATLAMRGRRPHGPGDLAERRVAPTP